MRDALISAGPAVFASAATVIAALFCLSLARVNGTSGLGPLGALGVFCAALSMLTLLPALLLIFGRRAFWPFVPHTPQTRDRARSRSRRTGASCWPRSSVGALAQAVGACLVAFVLLPLTVLSALVAQASRAAASPSVVSLLDGPVFTPYELRRVQARAPGRRDARLLEARRRPRRRQPGADLRRRRRDPARDVPRPGVLLDRPDHQRRLPDQGRVGRRARSCWPRASRPARARRRTSSSPTPPTSSACRPRSPPCRASRRCRRRWRSGDDGRTLLQATLTPPPYSTEAFDLIEPIRAAAGGAGVGRGAGRRRDRGRVRRPRRRGLGLDGDPADRARGRVPDPRAAAARGGRPAGADRHRDPVLRRRARRRLLRVRRALRLPGLGPVAAAVRVRVPRRAGRRLQHLPRRAGARGDVHARHARTGCCARWPSPAG